MSIFGVSRYGRIICSKCGHGHYDRPFPWAYTNPYQCWVCGQDDILRNEIISGDTDESSNLYQK